LGKVAFVRHALEARVVWVKERRLLRSTLAVAGGYDEEGKGATSKPFSHSLSTLWVPL